MNDATPTPVQIKTRLTLDNVDDYKRSDCASYGHCLEVACRAGWSQFTCNECEAYEKDEELMDCGELIKHLFDE